MKNLEKKEIDPSQKYVVLAKGTPVSPGIACGYVARNVHEARAIKDEGLKPILIRRRLETGDIQSIDWSEGILTQTVNHNSNCHFALI